MGLLVVPAASVLVAVGEDHGALALALAVEGGREEGGGEKGGLLGWMGVG